MTENLSDAEFVASLEGVPEIASDTLWRLLSIAKRAVEADGLGTVERIWNSSNKRAQREWLTKLFIEANFRDVAIRHGLAQFLSITLPLFDKPKEEK